MQKITEKDIQEYKQAFNNDAYATKYLLGVFTPNTVQMVKILRLRDEPPLSKNEVAVGGRRVVFNEVEEVF